MSKKTYASDFNDNKNSQLEENNRMRELLKKEHTLSSGDSYKI